jgi:hypothetical protein
VRQRHRRGVPTYSVLFAGYTCGCFGEFMILRQQIFKKWFHFGNRFLLPKVPMLSGGGTISRRRTENQ